MKYKASDLNTLFKVDNQGNGDIFIAVHSVWGLIFYDSYGFCLPKSLILEGVL